MKKWGNCFYLHKPEMGLKEQTDMDSEYRFKGAMSEEYRLIKLALPHFEELQEQVASAVAEYQKRAARSKLDGIDVGCGDGVTAHAILNKVPGIHLVCLDNERKMIEQAQDNLSEAIKTNRCDLVHADALEHFQSMDSQSVDFVASVLTLHNMEREYRDDLHVQIFRVLARGGLFVNADKYAPQDEDERFKALGTALKRFFDAYAPLGKLELLREWVLHNVADQAPDRCMKEGDTITILEDVGFNDIRILYRSNMEAVLVAYKP